MVVVVYVHPVDSLLVMFCLYFSQNLSESARILVQLQMNFNEKVFLEHPVDRTGWLSNQYYLDLSKL